MRVFALRLLSLAVLSTAPLNALDYYVSPTGNDANDGLAPGRAKRTIQAASNLTNPGDTVYLMDGEHGPTASSQDNGDIVTVRRSGTANAWIRYTALPGHKPVVFFRGWNAFKVLASFIEISDLEIGGNRAALTLEAAQAQPKTGNYNPAFNGNGILVDGRPPGTKIVGSRILRNVVRDCPGGGIAVIWADHVNIEDNVTYRNAWYSVFANSGITVYQPWNSDDSTDYKIFILRNESFQNQSLVPWPVIGALSDGNGIIYDDTRNSQNQNPNGVYRGRGLITNNVCYLNGGSGIHAFSSNDCDIINNTAYMNGHVVNYTDIHGNTTDRVRVLNNVVFTRPGRPANSNNRNTQLTTDHNLYYNHANTPIVGPNDRTGDPRFVRLPTETNPRGDFRLRPGSPARNTASATFAPANDLSSTARPIGEAPDLGAYEMPSISGNSSGSAQIVNLSTRSFVGTGGSVQIAGLVIGGSGKKRVLIRGSGPAIAELGVPGTVADPTMEINGTGAPLVNDDWDGLPTTAALAQSLGAFPFRAGSKDAVRIEELGPGGYTAKIEGRNGGTGIALVEVYDADAPGGAARLINISTRAEVRPDAGVVIAGFVIRGDGYKRVLIRAIGSPLSRPPYNISGTLADPQLTLSSSDGTIAVNDDWQGNRADLLAAFAAAGRPESDLSNADAAIVTTLQAGAYTCIVAGKGTASGIALVEVYELP